MRRTALAALSLLWAGCPQTGGIPCGDAGACPAGDYCIFSQCEAASAVLQNLSAVVYPNDPLIPPQQFLPADLTPVNGSYYELNVDPPQLLTGHVTLPTSCLLSVGDGGPNDAGYSDAGYPIVLQFQGPSLIPSVATTYEFTDYGPGTGNGVTSLDAGSTVNILGALPSQFNFQQRVSTASACAPPLLGPHDVFPGVYDVASVGIAIPPPSVIVSGILVPAAGDVVLQAGPAVRVRDPPDYNGGQSLSVDSMTSALTDGGYVTDAGVFDDGGYYVISLPVAAPKEVGAGPGCESIPGKTPTCYPFVVEIGPSAAVPDFPTIDLALEAPAPAPDGGIQLVAFNTTQLPIPVVPQLPVQISTAGSTGPLAGVVVEISTADGGSLFGCDGGCSFDFKLNMVNSTESIDLLPGTYLLTLDAQPPDGPSVTPLTVYADGGLLLADGEVVASEGDAGIVPLTALAPQHITGTALKPGSRSAVAGGQAEVLTLPDLTPIALQTLASGAFDLLVPPGQSYLLLVEPLNGTEFAPEFLAFSVTAGVDSAPLGSSFNVNRAGVLTGVVRLLADGGGEPPTPIPNALIEFYFTRSDATTGLPVAIPVASTVTDDQGNWSALGPASETE